MTSHCSARSATSSRSAPGTSDQPPASAEELLNWRMRPWLAAAMVRRHLAEQGAVMGGGLFLLALDVVAGGLRKHVAEHVGQPPALSSSSTHLVDTVVA